MHLQRRRYAGKEIRLVTPGWRFLVDEDLGRGVVYVFGRYFDRPLVPGYQRASGGQRFYGEFEHVWLWVLRRGVGIIQGVDIDVADAVGVKVSGQFRWWGIGW